MISAEDRRDDYPNLDPTVTIWRCTQDSPMDLEIGARAAELKKLIIHEGLEEIGESDSGRYVNYRCEFCTYSFWADFGD